MKKKIALAMISTAMGAALVGAGSFALFTDSATNAGNNFTAGTVDITDVTGGAALSTTAFIGNLAPGDAENATLTIRNDGSLDAWVRISSATNNGNGNFGDGVGDLFEGPTPLTISYDGGAVLVPAGGQTTFNVGYSFPLAAGNDYQGDTGSVTFNVDAVQARNNTNVGNTGPIAWN